MESATFTENNLSGKMTLKKYKNHLSITAITKRMKNLGNFTFSFNFISHDDIVKELNKLKTKKASQKTYSYKNCQGKCRYHIPFPVS